MTYQIPTGQIQCPPYCESRYTLHAGDEVFDVLPVPDNAPWKATFPDVAVDWQCGWRTLWMNAGSLLGTGTDYVPGRVAIEVQAYLADGQMCNVGALVECQSNDWECLEAATRSQLIRVVGSDELVDGWLGLVASPDDEQARPCLTLLVSGPGGGGEAAMMILQQLGLRRLDLGVSIRTIRNNSVGVLKIPFLPELYRRVGRPSFGIRWDLWSSLARQRVDDEWGRACLLWCSALIEAVEELKENLGLMVDEAYFDFMRVIPLSDDELRLRVMTQESSISDSFQLGPKSFIFRDPKLP